jgi:hypothetical protein
MPASLTDNRKITRPYSKLTRLCAEAAARGGELTTFSAVAKAIGVTPGRVTQMFGYGLEAEGVVIKAETVGLIVAAFRGDGAPCEIDWFYLGHDDFATRVATAGVRPSSSSEPLAGDWELREATVLVDLVELRLHPPRPGNEFRDSYYVDATLLFGTANCDYFGTANCDYDPEAGLEPRTISISLRDARVAIGSESYQPLQGSMIGERISSENFRRVAGGIDITGPKGLGGTLDGDPIGDNYLAVIAPTNAGDVPFAVTVAAGRRSFVVADSDRPNCDSAAETKNAILNQFIYSRCNKDEAGRAVLAQATMKLRERSNLG